MKEHPHRALKSFPRTWYFPKWNLVTWHPRGVLDDTLADQIVAFIEMEERIQAAPFDRYVDLSCLTRVRLEAGHVFDIAKRRHLSALAITAKSTLAFKRHGDTIGAPFMSKKEIPADRSTAGVARSRLTQRPASSVKDKVP